MATTSVKSLEWFLAQSETKPYSEYAQGQVVQKPMPEFDHGALQLYLGHLLLIYLERTRLGRTVTELRCIFGPDGNVRTYVPDLVFIAAGRLTRTRHLHAAPDIAVEVLSPGQPNRFFREKLRFYLENGVRLVWVLDPKKETVQVLAPGHALVTLTKADRLDGGDVLPGFSASVAQLFAQVWDE